jgi:hypothetical protein
MLFTSPLPPLSSVQRRTLPADVGQRPAPADWPFAPELTACQRDAARNTIARAHGRHLSRRFTGAAVTGFGGLL